MNFNIILGEMNGWMDGLGVIRSLLFRLWQKEDSQISGCYWQHFGTSLKLIVISWLAKFTDVLCRAHTRPYSQYTTRWMYLIIRDYNYCNNYKYCHHNVISFVVIIWPQKSSHVYPLYAYSMNTYIYALIFIGKYT